MFEAAEIGQELSKADYKKREPELRRRLIEMQQGLRVRNIPVIVLIAGDDRPGCDDVLSLLNEWLDPRFVDTNAFGLLSDEEQERPPFWRFWRSMPPKGRVGVFLGAWNSHTIDNRLSGKLTDADWLHLLSHIRRLEQMLMADGAIVVKFWLHLPKKELRKRLKAAEKDPDREWRVQPEDWRIYDSYNEGLPVVENLIQQTSHGDATWRIVESTDARYRDVAVAERLLATIEPYLAATEPSSAPAGTMKEKPEENPTNAIVESVSDPLTVLDTLDLTAKLEKEKYEKQLEKYQARLHSLAARLRRRDRSAALVFEGWDAGGKGGAIRRLVAALNPQMFRIVPVAAPTDEELQYHYLWRFWKHIPRAGRFVIFDRSWYGRVLVERVEGYATRQEWKRAYAEINDFECQLIEHGMVVCKFWLHISAEEQLRRFEEREEIAYKQFKITQEDYRNRDRWSEYESAANEMFAQTSTQQAPWNLVPANDKRWARIHVLKTVCKALEIATKK